MTHMWSLSFLEVLNLRNLVKLTFAQRHQTRVNCQVTLCFLFVMFMFVTWIWFGLEWKQGWIWILEHNDQKCECETTQSTLHFTQPTAPDWNIFSLFYSMFESGDGRGCRCYLHIIITKFAPSDDLAVKLTLSWAWWSLVKNTMILLLGEYRTTFSQSLKSKKSVSTSLAGAP